MRAQAGFWGPTRAGLARLEEDQSEGRLAGPRQTRQVPASRVPGKMGSRMEGASSRARSLATCAGPMVAAARMSAAVQAAPLAQKASEMPGAVLRYQSEGWLASMMTVPPSPEESCCQAVWSARPVDTVPEAPRPARRMAGSSGSWAKETTSAREPRVRLRFWKWDESSGEQGLACWLMVSVERHRPPSLPR